MATMLIANNCTVESGSFMGDQLCALKTCYLFVENQPDVDKIIMSMSPRNELHFLWTKFIEKYNVEVIWDSFDAGDWPTRFASWDKWRAERQIEGRHFDHYREHYLRIHGAQRQTALCGCERGLGRKSIFEYWLAGQENCPDTFPGADWFDDSLIHHPQLSQIRDVYISPHCKTQGNYTFTFSFWEDVVRRLLDNDVTVTVGFNGPFLEWDEHNRHPNYLKYWGDYKQWMTKVCRHKLVACGNTGTGWLAAACGVSMITMEPHNSVMADHRYRECGLKNIIEVVDGYKLDEYHNDMEKVAEYVARRIIEQVRRCIVMTTGCYDVFHSGHVRHLQRSKALGTKLIVALNSDSSIKQLKGDDRPINNQARRKAVLEELRCVDEVRIFDGLDARSLIKEIKPDILTAGYGYSEDMIVGREFVESYGGKVVVTCKGDSKDEPSTTKIVKRLKASELNDIIRVASQYSVNPPEKLRLLAEQLLSVSHLEGDIADLGTYKGGSALVLRRLALERHLHCFDTWQGTPYDDPLCHHKKGEWAASLEDCRKLVGTGNLTYYHPDIFPIGPSYADAYVFALVFVDMDTYQATKDAIDFFWPRLVKGGKLVFDDYGWEPCSGVKKAVDESFSQDQLSVATNLYTCVITKE